MWQGQGSKPTVGLTWQVLVLPVCSLKPQPQLRAHEVVQWFSLPLLRASHRGNNFLPTALWAVLFQLWNFSGRLWTGILPQIIHILQPVMKLMYKKPKGKKNYKVVTLFFTFMAPFTGQWVWQLCSEMSTWAPLCSLNKLFHCLQAFLFIPAPSEGWSCLPLMLAALYGEFQQIYLPVGQSSRHRDTRMYKGW